MVPPSDECPEALHLALVDVFDNILHPEFENDIHIFWEKLTEAMQTRKAHVLFHHVPKYVRRTGDQLGLTSEQVLESQHTLFGIFYHRFEVNCTKSPEHLFNAVLHYNSYHL